MTETHAAAIYARYSTDKQDARSIDDQLRRCREYAQRHGYVVRCEHCDEAKSGASRFRTGLQALLAQAQTRPRRFTVILVDDLSRLSRDLGDTWRIIFEDLRVAGVRLIGVADGVDSEARNARVDIGIRAVVNTAFLEMVKSETHRGLEGRALAGFHTGGACYGYTTVSEENPRDPEHPRMVVRIEQDEAQVVRRIFALYADGTPLREIADALNREQVRAPQDGSCKKRAGRGWSKSQLGFMLRNERYVGRVVWNKREWIKVDGKRRPRMRPESEWKVREEPALAIIDAATWGKVQARHAENAKGPGRPGRSGYLDHVLSGLLQCGCCGSPMSIVSRRMKGGRAYAQYGCSARHHKGASVCGNALTVGEARLTDAVVTALRSYFASSEYERWLAEAYEANQRARERAARRDDDVARLEGAIRAAEARVEKVTEALARIGYSEPLAQKLRAEEAKLLNAREALAGAAPAVRPAAPLPSYARAAVLAVMENLASAVLAKPQKGRHCSGPSWTGSSCTPRPTGTRCA
jgi:site-specific DNA recombinase